MKFIIETFYDRCFARETLCQGAFYQGHRLYGDV
jgi:hypothetical protein